MMSLARASMSGPTGEGETDSTSRDKRPRPRVSILSRKKRRLFLNLASSRWSFFLHLVHFVGHFLEPGKRASHQAALLLPVHCPHHWIIGSKGSAPHGHYQTNPPGHTSCLGK